MVRWLAFNKWAWNPCFECDGSIPSLNDEFPVSFLCVVVPGGNFTLSEKIGTQSKASMVTDK